MNKALDIQLATEISPMLIKLSYKKPQDKSTLIDLLEQELQKYKGYTLCLSGGYDSQFLFLLLKQFGIEFNCVSYSMLWKDDVVNANDFLAAQRLCKKYNVSLDTVEIDATEFFESGEYGLIAKKYQCFSPQIALHCKFLENLPYNKLLLGGDIPKVEYDFDKKIIGRNGDERAQVDSLLFNKRFVGTYCMPYEIVQKITGKQISKNIFLETPEIYYLSIMHNINIIEKYKVILGVSHNTEIYRYKEYFYNELLEENFKLSFRLKASTGFESLKAHLASITGNFDEFNDRYRDQTIRMNNKLDAKFTIKGNNSELNYIQEQIHKKINEINPDVIEDFIIEI
tara:strand:+ start:3543 stop:4565 length:1023 start_codon:yes stop_codon:yes gene_type:complete